MAPGQSAELPLPVFGGGPSDEIVRVLSRNSFSRRPPAFRLD